MTQAKPESDPQDDADAKVSGDRSDLGQVKDTLAESLEKERAEQAKDNESGASSDED